ncbi:response regulator [Planctomicrobium sp. SH527]|uniref:response regulator n=1 Tax=Planctomicrobium sp. SH527 TaxID=3448123 RepID=UPI003F5BDA9B
MVASNSIERCLLIADDNAAYRDAIVEILEPYFHTIAVPSGEDAIEIVATVSVHLALFDLNMNLLSGLDAIRWLRDHHLELPCILMSADVTDQIENEASALETFRVLRKPVGRSELLDTIHCALEL